VWTWPPACKTHLRPQNLLLFSLWSQVACTRSSRAAPKTFGIISRTRNGTWVTWPLRFTRDCGLMTVGTISITSPKKYKTLRSNKWLSFKSKLNLLLYLQQTWELNYCFLSTFFICIRTRKWQTGCLCIILCLLYFFIDIISTNNDFSALIVFFFLFSKMINHHLQRNISWRP